MELNMQVSKSNENGVLPDGATETVARLGRYYAAIDFALAEVGLYRYSINLFHCHIGFCSPICANDPGFRSLEAARTAGLEELCRRWPCGEHIGPQGVRNELAELRRQVESRLRQPSLF
jgi:hypothetical protein